MVGKLGEGAMKEGEVTVGEVTVGEGAVGEGGDSLVLVVEDVEDQQGGIMEGDLKPPPMACDIEERLYLLAER